MMPDLLRKIAGIRIHLKVDDPETATTYRFGFDFPLVWSLYKVMMGGRNEQEGLTHAWRLALFGAGVAISKQHETDGQDIEVEVPNDTDYRLQFMIFNLWQTLKQRYPTQDDILLDVSYDALQSGLFTRTDAGEFASLMLQERIESEAWRKRVNKYADAQGLKRPELKGGRPKTRNKNPENSG
jgi:hypothetical protein